MRWATFRDGTGTERVGVVSDGDILALAPGVRLLDLIGDDGED